jgi:alpha-ribazole phosphatase/probable phosphoglycerate mutase
MAPKKTLLLVRHGRIERKFDGRLVGATDAPLAGDARREIEALAKLVRDRKPDRFLCSPQMRARQTADIIGEEVGLSVEVDPDLREIDFGRWEAMTFEEIAEAEPEMTKRWARWDDDFAFPGGESLKGFLARVKETAGRMGGAAEETILAVTHGGVIRAMICHLLGLPDREYVLFDVKRASLTTLEVFEDRGVLTALSVAPHPGE